MSNKSATLFRTINSCILEDFTITLPIKKNVLLSSFNIYKFYG